MDICVSKIKVKIKEEMENLSSNLAKASAELTGITPGAGNIIERPCRSSDFEIDEYTLSAAYKFDS
jgi:hypothetical protein